MAREVKLTSKRNDAQPPEEGRAFVLNERIPYRELSLALREFCAVNTGRLCAAVVGSCPATAGSGVRLARWSFTSAYSATPPLKSAQHFHAMH